MNAFGLSATAHAFARGWRDAALGIAAETPRQVIERFQEYTSAEAEAYLNGTDDGRTGERFRLEGR